jgi:tRNA(fMet)-specific endonuclease VapC
MIILDTDTLTHVQRRSGSEYERLAARLDEFPPEQICTTVVSFEEQLRGWLAYVAKARDDERLTRGYAKLLALLEDFSERPVLAFGPEAARECRQLAKAKIRIGTLDQRIAAIALTRDALLLSQNLAHFRKVPGLQVEDWTR